MRKNSQFVLFKTLLAFRGAFRVITKYLLILMIILNIFSWFIDVTDTNYAGKIFMLLLALMIIAIRWGYDELIFKIKPDDYNLMLFE